MGYKIEKIGEHYWLEILNENGWASINLNMETHSRNVQALIEQEANNWPNGCKGTRTNQSYLGI